MALGRLVFPALLGALMGAAQLSAQTPTGTLTGRVFDAATQEALSGVAVRVGPRGALSGPDGRFTVPAVPAGTQTVRATRVGYAEATRTVSVAAGQTATLDIAMTSQAVALEGLVVVGYGQQEARDVTGAVRAVTPEEFNTGRVVSPEQLIQAKVAGVQVVESNEPGGGMNIRIRGGTSVNASNEPLFVVDGVPLPLGGGLSAGRNPLNFINPQDIANITVLKDASSTAIYGSRGANGVVLIETKNGRRAPAFSYNGSYSNSRVTRTPDLMDAGEFRAAVQQYAPDRASRLGNASTDWYDLVLRDAVGQEHNVAVAGSGDNMNYRLSLGYLEQEGVVLGSTTERISAAINYNQRLFDDRLNLRATVRGARTDDLFDAGILGDASRFAPTQPVREGDSYFEWTQFNLGPNNPLSTAELEKNSGYTLRSVGNIEAQYRFPFLEGLSATTRVGYDIAESSRRIFRPSIQRSQVEGSEPGYLSSSTPAESNVVFDIFGNLTRELDALNSDLDFTAGYSYETFQAETPFFEAFGLTSDLLGPNGVPTARRLVSRLDNVRESKLASFFARANYTLADRYLLTLSVRRDGSSRFGPDNQWGTFPAAALAWRVNEEAFLDNLDWLSDLKLRASWGVNGNQSFGDYLWISTYRYSDEAARVQFGDEFINTIRPSAVDPNIKWEETTSWNVGVDYGFFDDRITGSLEYYLKDTDDLIFNVPVAAGTNFSDRVTTNIGSVRNQGLEFSLNAGLLQGGRSGLNWDVSFNAARNQNELLTISGAGGVNQILVGGIAGGVGSNIQVLRPGQAVNSFLVYRHIRENGKPIYKDRQGVDNNGKFTNKPDGQINEQDLYEDINGDGQITEADRRIFENPTPDWIFGHTSNVTYGNFDLGFTLRAYLGNYVYNNLASNRGNYRELLATGSPENLHRSVLETGFLTPQYFSDVYVEDASFLRMDNITLGYVLPRFRGVQRMRVFGTVQNAFTLTGYDGVDPTAGLNGIDNNIYPRSRTFTVGVNVDF